MNILKQWLQLLLVFGLIFIANNKVHAIYNGQRLDQFELEIDPNQFESIVSLAGGGDHRGTGTHIGGGMLLTAQHVWDQIKRLTFYEELEIRDPRGELIASINKNEIEVFLPDEITTLQLQLFEVSEPDVAIIVPRKSRLRDKLAKLPEMTLYRPEVSRRFTDDYIKTLDEKTLDEIQSETQILYRGEIKRFLTAGYGYTSLKRELGDDFNLHVGEIIDPYVDPGYLKSTGRPIAIESSGVVESAFPDSTKSRSKIDFAVARPGDSGGPLLQVIDGKIYQIGIASSGGVFPEGTGRYDSEIGVEIIRFTTRNTWSSTDTSEFISLIRKVRKMYPKTSSLNSNESTKKILCESHF